MASSNQTRTANDFLQSIGVNTHLSWQDLAGYANPSVVEKSIAYLGATHVRDGIPYTYGVRISAERLSFRSEL